MNTSIFALLLSVSLSGLAIPANALSSDHSERHNKQTHAAAPDKINRMVSNSFKTDFNNAEILSYTMSHNVINLTFITNGLVMHAFYTDNGELLGITRNILTNQLPIALLLKFRQDYQGFWVTDLFEATNQEDHNYFITLENSETRIVLKSTDDSNWEIYKKTIKE